MKEIKVTMPELPFDQLDPENGADPMVLRFIKDFYSIANDKESIRVTFMHGYCYYFAHILQEAFHTGQVCWCAPNGHFVWCADYKGCTYAYDVEGVSIAEAEYYIPEKYMGDFIYDFKHIPGIGAYAYTEDIDRMIDRYLRDLKGD